MDKAKLKQEVARRVEDRKAAEKEIAELAKKREEFLTKNAKDSDGFDSKVKTSIEKQLAKKK
jgi:hypothetical protein